MVTYSRAPGSQQFMLCFAQNREDVLIERVFRKPAGLYVDVGAGHPTTDSVTKYFSLAGWRGINIEPGAEHWAELTRDRPRDVNLQCAAGRTRGRGVFYLMPNRDMSTLSTAQLERLGPAHRAGAVRTEVDVRTLADVCAEYVKDATIDFLKVDAQGAEADVLAGADWDRYRPRLVVVKATLPWSSELNCADWEPALLANDYLFQYFDGLSRFYLRREDEKLSEQFSVPVNVLDFYITFRDAELRQTLDATRNELQRLKAGVTVPTSSGGKD